MEIVFKILIVLSLILHIAGIIFSLKALRYKTSEIPKFPVINPKKFLNRETRKWFNPKGYKLWKAGTYCLGFGGLAVFVAIVFFAI